MTLWYPLRKRRAFAYAEPVEHWDDVLRCHPLRQCVSVEPHYEHLEIRNGFSITMNSIGADLPL